MYFLVPKDKKTLLFYIIIILLGMILEHFQVISTEKVVAIGLLLGLIIMLLTSYSKKS